MASYHFYLRVKPSISVRSDEQHFLFLQWFPLLVSQDRWFPVAPAAPAAVGRGILILREPLVGNLSPKVHREGLSGLAEQACLGCQRFILLDMIFLKPHGYPLCHF